MIAVTGANGFIGQALCRALHVRGFGVRGIVRSLHTNVPAFVEEPVVVGNINAATDWSLGLAGVECVIHCAGRAHVPQSTDPYAAMLNEYRSVNVEGARRLAEQAAAAGVRRLVFLSSIRVLGFQNMSQMQMHDHDTPKPDNPYGVSKWEAEQALWAVAANTGLEVVMVRPPLVYGPGAKGNVARLMKLIRWGLPLPFGAVHNQRSFIGLDNLADLLILCVEHPAAVGQTLMVSDDNDMSTPDLLRLIAAEMGSSISLLPVPVSLLRLAGRALGKQAEIDRLVGSLQIDSRHTRELLDWTPPVSVAEGIRRMVQGS